MELFSMSSRESIKNLQITLKPLLKWSGGIQKDSNLLLKHIPQFNRYIDPFFGSGGIFFLLKPDKNALINDKNNELVRFYQLIGKKSFKNELDEFVDGWQLIKDFFNIINNDIQLSFNDMLNDYITPEELPYLIRAIIITNADDPTISNLFAAKFIIDQDNFINSLIYEVVKKIIRLHSAYINREKIYPKEQVDEHIETAIKSGFYMHFRKILNDSVNTKKYKISEEKWIAVWLIVMELSQNSVEVLSNQKEINLPYGGKKYNSRNIRHKINAICNQEVIELLKKSEIFNMDFQEFIENLDLTTDDFLFVDPPFESNFLHKNELYSEHERLANTLFKLNSKWLLIAEKSTFINKLYNKPGISIEKLGKEKVRDRVITYDIIKNY